MNTNDVLSEMIRAAIVAAAGVLAKAAADAVRKALENA